MKPGDTFLILAEQPKKHLWVIVSDPAANPDLVVCLSFTTLRDKSDRSCVVQPGEHPFVQEATCIAYRHGRHLSLQQLQAMAMAGALQMREPVSEALLARIRQGARESDFTIFLHRRVLVDQGLIDPGE